MFGYRLTRESDWDALLTDLKTLRERERALHHDIVTLTADARSAKTLYEAIMSRVNVLELENATYRNKTTGLPAVAPQLAKANPLAGSAIGAGVDLFEDVGDEMARDLRDKGLLHVNDEIPEPPTGALLSAGLAGR